MRILLLLVSLFDAWFALRALGHLVGLLRYGKFSHVTEIGAGLLLAGMAAVGFWVFWAEGDLRLGFGVALGPWLLLLVVMGVALVTGRQQ